MALCGVPSLLTTLQGFVPATAQAFERVLNVKGGPRHEDGGLVASDDHLLGSHISNWPAAFLILLRSRGRGLLFGFEFTQGREEMRDLTRDTKR